MLPSASHRIQRHRRPLDREQVREFGDVRDPVLPVPADLPTEDDARVAAPGRDHVQGGLAVGRRPPRRPAVDGDGRALDPSGQPGHPPGNATPDSRGSSARNTAESVSWERIPFSNGAGLRRNSSLSSPWRAISTKLSQPDTTPQRPGSRSSSSGCITFACCRGSVMDSARS